jgi:hypothetical protein
MVLNKLHEFNCTIKSNSDGYAILTFNKKEDYMLFLLTWL